MGLRDPVAVYNAATNMDAQMVRNALLATGVEAHVTEDLSRAGTWVGGVISEIHKPQVWVDRCDIERAKPVLEEYERRALELQAASTDEAAAGEAIEVVCEECGESSTFPVAQRGSVQECPHCNAYLDVEVDEEQRPE